jgi:hypothetical protein
MRRLPKILSVVALVASLAAASPAIGGPARGSFAAFARGDYVQPARQLAPIAQRKNPHAMAMLGFMYQNGFGVPQSYDAAVELYIGAAERGDPSAQRLLGLMYDKGQGVDRDDVVAYKWLSLAAAAAPIREREPYFRIRDAVASKMSLDQIIEGSASRWIGGNGREARAVLPPRAFVRL